MEEEGERVVPPGGLDIDDVRRQGEIMRKASPNSAVRQFRYGLADVADGFDDAVKTFSEALEADPDAMLAIELAGALTPGMKVMVPQIGVMKVSRILRRDGDWSLHLVITEPWQLEFTGNKRDYYENLPAMGSTPVVVWA